MTKQILAFLFCFTRELTLYSPLTYTLTSARELKPPYSPLTYTLTLRLEPLGSLKPVVLPSAHTLNREHRKQRKWYYYEDAFEGVEGREFSGGECISRAPYKPMIRKIS